MNFENDQIQELSKCLGSFYCEIFEGFKNGKDLEKFHVMEERIFYFFVIEKITLNKQNQDFRLLIEKDFFSLIPYKKKEWLDVLNKVLKYQEEIESAINHVKQYGLASLSSNLFTLYCKKYIDYIVSTGWRSKNQLIIDYIEAFDKKSDISYYNFIEKKNKSYPKQLYHEKNKFEIEDEKTIILQYEIHSLFMEYMRTKNRQIIEDNNYLRHVILDINNCISWTNLNRFEIIKIARKSLSDGENKITNQSREKLLDLIKRDADWKIYELIEEYKHKDDSTYDIKEWREDFEKINKEIFYQTSDEVILERYNFEQRGEKYKNMYIKEYTVEEINAMPGYQKIVGMDYSNPISRQHIVYNSPKETIINPLNQYERLLMMKEWKDKRSLIIDRDGGICQQCGSTKDLNVHHKLYIWGRKPWEYSNEDLVTVCNDCHRKIHEEKRIPVYFDDKKITTLKIDSCERCSGSGYLAKYHYYKNGICFRCMGTGYALFIDSFKSSTFAKSSHLR